MLLRLILLLALSLAAWADGVAGLCSDRMAVERVYYLHRTGEKPPFEETLSRAALENLVRQDLKKEAALRERYGITITPAMIEAEVQRINTTTRAPERLAEIKAALGHDPARFANAVAKPIVVERLLRDRFDNDDTLHLSQRRQAERVRDQVLAAKGEGQTVANLVTLLAHDRTNEVSETTWLLTKRPMETNLAGADEIEIKKAFGPKAQLLSSPRHGAQERKFYFEDLAPALQKVLSVQLRKAGDVSAVIELPDGFALYLLKEKKDEAMAIASVALRKRGYEQWLAEEAGHEP